MFNLNVLLALGVEQVSVISLKETIEIGYWHPDIFFNNEVLTIFEKNVYIISECLKVVRDGGFLYYRSLVKPKIIIHK